MSNSSTKHYYLINLQFLGFRYSGWQKQTNAKTIQGMVDKTFCFIFGHENFKTLGAGRTDAKVSANQFAFELFVDEKLDEQDLLIQLNENLPPDLKALDINQVDDSFNVIKDPKIKEYYYIFNFHERIHPFCAPFMVSFKENLDIELMIKGAKLFKGLRNFHQFCYKPNSSTEFEREVVHSEIVENKIFTGNFFPERSWIFHVHGKGFMRHQIRMMMGALVNLGRGDITLVEIEESLKGELIQGKGVGFIAPSSGLVLNRVEFKL